MIQVAKHTGTYDISNSTLNTTKTTSTGTYNTST